MSQVSSTQLGSCHRSHPHSQGHVTGLIHTARVMSQVSPTQPGSCHRSHPHSQGHVTGLTYTARVMSQVSPTQPGSCHTSHPHSQGHVTGLTHTARVMSHVSPTQPGSCHRSHPHSHGHVTGLTHTTTVMSQVTARVMSQVSHLFNTRTETRWFTFSCSKERSNNTEMPIHVTWFTASIKWKIAATTSLRKSIDNHHSLLLLN